MLILCLFIEALRVNVGVINRLRFTVLDCKRGFRCWISIFRFLSVKSFCSSADFLPLLVQKHQICDQSVLLCQITIRNVGSKAAD